MRESTPPPTIAAGEIVILQPYGSLFFASAPVFEQQVLDQVLLSGLADELGPGNVYRSTEWIGETVRRAYADALEQQRRG